jgi:hypothetical protein
MPFNPGGSLNAQKLLHNNVTKILNTLHSMSSIGVNASGFNRLLFTRFYANLICPQLEYGLSINSLSATQLKIFEDAQNQFSQKIYGGHRRSSTKVMPHLTKLPPIKDCLHILQTQFLLRSLYLPDDTFFYRLLPLIKHNCNYQWQKLSTTPFWKTLPTRVSQMNTRTFKQLK